MVDFGSAGSIGNLLPHGRALRIALTLPRTAPPAPPPACTRHPRPVPDAPNNFTGHLQGRLTIMQKGKTAQLRLNMHREGHERQLVGRCHLWQSRQDLRTHQPTNRHVGL